MDIPSAGSVIDQTLRSLLDTFLEDAPDRIAVPIRYAVLAPGKRIRPLLVLAAYDAVSGTRPLEKGVSDPVVRLACGVELVHAYSLVHDDLPCMDDDDLRRGRPTVHVQFGERDAVLAGAALMPLAVEVVTHAAQDLGVAEETAGCLAGILTSASGGAGMVGGQLLDLKAEGREVDVDELDRIHRGKTSRLIEASCLMGGVAAGGEAEEIRRLGAYGRSLGLAFQVVDDILDVTGSTQAMGKTGGRDAELGKATYPNVVGLERARERAAELVGAALDEIEPMQGAATLSRIARMVLDRER
jgi:geranylgeranyl pyrophosphate synthase